MPAPGEGAPRARRLALAAWLGLLVLVLGWEAWGAPATPVPRAFWLALKGLPLIAALPWLWRGAARAYVLAALVALAYFCEGVAVAYEAARSGALPALAYGALEMAATVLFVAAAGIHARFNFPRARAETES